MQDAINRWDLKIGKIMIQVVFSVFISLSLVQDMALVSTQIPRQFSCLAEPQIKGAVAVDGNHPTVNLMFAPR